MKKNFILTVIFTIMILTSACGNNNIKSQNNSAVTTSEVPDEKNNSENLKNQNSNEDFNEDSKIKLNVSNPCAMLDDEFGIVFSVELSEEVARDCGEIGLYNEDGNKIADMLDDGNDCDINAGDYIFSARYISDEPLVYKLYAKSDNFETDKINVSYIDTINDEYMDETDKLIEKVENTANSLKDKNGNIPYDKRNEAYDMVVKYLEELYEEGKILEYHKNDSNVEMKFYTGITYIYEIMDPRCD